MNELDRQAYDLGWDYATFGICVPDDASMSFCDGYRAFSLGQNKTSHKPGKYARKWLQIRFGALSRGKQFSLDITPEYIEKITPASGNCPITDQPLTYSACQPTDWSVDRANNDRGYVRGNILIISELANSAKGNKSFADIVGLSHLETDCEGLSPQQWSRLARLIEPAFGDEEDEVNPIQMLFGQPIALGMPVSPLASFQVAVSRAAVGIWDPAQENIMVQYLNVMSEFICRNRKQHKALENLLKEVMRRSRHLRSYSDIWATDRIQKRLLAFINTLGGPGLNRLVQLQEFTVGNENTKIV